MSGKLALQKEKNSHHSQFQATNLTPLAAALWRAEMCASSVSRPWRPLHTKLTLRTSGTKYRWEDAQENGRDSLLGGQPDEAVTFHPNALLYLRNFVSRAYM